MAIRGDVTIDWSVSPRVITVASPSVEITCQDLFDTLRFLESQSDAMDDPGIVDAAGKESLGGGVSVGLTVTLLNALVAFESRIGPTYEQCRVNGGNLVAIDSNGFYFSTPISPTAFTQVITTASSSATTQSQAQLEYSTYQNGVWVDVVNGTAGVEFPIGTPGSPVSNMSDAYTIATTKGFTKIYILGDIVLDSETSLSGFTLIGQNASRTHITINPNAYINNCEIYEAHVEGTLDGSCIIRKSVIHDLALFNGFLFQCSLYGTITLGGGIQANILDCYSGIPGNTTPCINMGGSGQSLAVRGYSGGLELINKTGPEPVSIDFNAGQLKIDLSTVTNGTIVIRGVGNVVDPSQTDDAQKIITHGQYGNLYIDNYTVTGHMVTELWQLQGLDPDHPLTVTPSSRFITGSDISQTITGDGTTTSTVTRDIL